MPKRYFEELSFDSKFKPGTLSPDLRNALGLHDDKLPIWIYRMRILGYPPGWLKEADMSKTVVSIIDDSQKEATPTEVDKNTWNVESLISYPGFNSPLPEGVKDDHKLLGMPPMMPHQQLVFATAGMKKPAPVPYKRIRISLPENKETEGANQDEARSLNESKEKEETSHAQENGGCDEESLTETKEEKASETPTKLISVGVPVPEVTKKPPLEKWSENNSLADLIYFENLPNYTGVFDKMRSVLGKVRSKQTAGGGQNPPDEPGPSSEDQV